MTIIKKDIQCDKTRLFLNILHSWKQRYVYQQIHEALCVNIVFIVNLQEITGIKWFGVLNASEIL